MFDCQKLLETLKNFEDLFKLYSLEFKSIPYFDEDEDQCITPDEPNGYLIQPNILKLFE